jgi:peroxiredoxin
MKQKLLPLLVVVAALLAGCQPNPKGLVINGQVDGADNQMAYLLRFDDKAWRFMDSVQVTNGTFSFNEPDAVLPELYGLTLSQTKNPLMLFLGKEPVTVKLDAANYRKSVVEGSALQKEYDAYMAENSEKGINIMDYIQAHPASLVGTYMLYRNNAYRMTPDELRAAVAVLDPSMHQTQYVKVIEKLITTMESVAVGKKAPDFTLNDAEGNPVRLYDHIGKGYLLLDFWASWCEPCREENPNLVKTYKTFHPRGFDILAVSLDRDKADWLAAIEKDGLTWTHVSDLLLWESAPAALYGVRAIPANVLIDKDGTIIAKNIMGDELNAKLTELLPK